MKVLDIKDLMLLQKKKKKINHLCLHCVQNLKVTLK